MLNRIAPYSMSTVIFVILSTVFATVSSLAARGPPVALQFGPAAPLTSDSSPLKAENVTLWCAPDNPQVTMTKASFVRLRDNKRFEARLSSNKRNATLFFERPEVADVAGDYQCDINTQYGQHSVRVPVYSRPIGDSTNDKLTAIEGKDKFEGQDVFVEPGASVNITCPVFFFPVGSVRWTKDGKNLELDKIEQVGKTIRIKAVDAASHEGAYACEAVNDYTAYGKVSRPSITIVKKLIVKSPYAWIVPLVLIIAIMTAVVIIIVFCEWSKRTHKKHDSYVVQE